MQLKDFEFALPPNLIARYPLEKRSASRLLCLDSQTGKIEHNHFSSIISLLDPGDLLVFNDTKVIPARLLGQKTTGGQVEILIERILDKKRILGQIRVSKPPQIGSRIILSANISLEVLNRHQQFYELGYTGFQGTILEVIESLGQIPLPPYIHRPPEVSDLERYQTIYAKNKGSVAAPTAGFHFDRELIAQLQEKKVNTAFLTLHIGAGTFAPVRADNIKDHKMHAEYLEVSDELCALVKKTKANGRRVIAVGTTSLRALETAYQSGQMQPYEGETSIFIFPGYSFRSADALITNFHLPCSTLLMLVTAFGGYERVMRAYREAVLNSYRFYSYGDAMWLTRA